MALRKYRRTEKCHYRRVLIIGGADRRDETYGVRGAEKLSVPLPAVACAFDDHKQILLSVSADCHAQVQKRKRSCAHSDDDRRCRIRRLYDCSRDEQQQASESEDSLYYRR